MKALFDMLLTVLLPAPAKPKADAPGLFILGGTQMPARSPFGVKADAESVTGPAGACYFQARERETLRSAPDADALPAFSLPDNWSL